MMMHHDGIVYLATLTNTAGPGDMPKEQLQFVGRFWFEERMIGLQRQMIAKGASQHVDMLIRIKDFSQSARIGMFAVLGNGDQFRIINVNKGRENDGVSRFTELTLERLDRLYDIFHQ